MSNLQQYWDAAPEIAQRMAHAEDAAKAELTALRKDAERYRWLQRWADAPNCGALQGFAHVIIPGKFGIGPAMSAGALDAAIDAAMAVGAA